MKFTILISILFDLLAKRKVTAAYLAEKHRISPRTVYRYIDLLSQSVPVRIQRGRSGGIYISDSYKLPVGFMTAEEYEAAIEALGAMYTQRPEERFLAAKRKLSAQVKAESRDAVLSDDIENILVEGSFGDTRALSEKVRVLEECIRDLAVTEIGYSAPTGEKITQKIEPHVLVFKQNAGYVYAFSHKQRTFQLFRLGQIFSVLKTEETFRKRPFRREDILPDAPRNVQTVDVRFEILESALERAQDWLGAENLRFQGGKWYADVALHDEEALTGKIIGFGAGIKVLSPLSLQKRIASSAAEIAKLYP